MNRELLRGELFAWCELLVGVALPFTGPAFKVLEQVLGALLRPRQI